jgi:hypothetical protein
MLCERISLLNSRIRVASASAAGGQCAIARQWLDRAARDLKTLTPKATGACERVRISATGEMLASTRRALAARCGRS